MIFLTASSPLAERSVPVYFFLPKLLTAKWFHNLFLCPKETYPDKLRKPPKIYIHMLNIWSIHAQYQLKG
jgi:hypothetical protein